MVIHHHRVLAAKSRETHIAAKLTSAQPSSVFGDKPIAERPVVKPVTTCVRKHGIKNGRKEAKRRKRNSIKEKQGKS
jgi:hypothetical protein